MNLDQIKYETKACVVCGEKSLIELDGKKYHRWTEGGEHVQNVWPEKTADERELLITGTHPDCWNNMFGGIDSPIIESDS